MRSITTVLAVLAVLAGASCSTDEPEPTAGPTAGATPPSRSADPVDPPPSTTVEVSTALPPRPRTARQAARHIASSERGIADPETDARDLRILARTQQRAYRVLGTHPAWDAEVYRRVGPELRRAVRDNVAARRDFRSMHSTLSDALPAWRIVRPAPAADLMRFYEAAEAEYGVGWEYLAAINLVETAMGRIRGTSVAGAQGPMQFLPTTWARWGRGDIDDPADAITAAARYLASNGFTRGPRGVANALFEYNNHPAYVRGVTAYARVMERDPRAFLGYHQWDVYYLTTEGDVVLPVGYERTRPVPVRRYLATHPQR